MIGREAMIIGFSGRNEYPRDATFRRRVLYKGGGVLREMFLNTLRNRYFFFVLQIKGLAEDDLA
jgi:hypothetical protein